MNKTLLKTEDEILNLQLLEYEQNIKQLQEKEKALMSMPYSSEYPRVYNFKHTNCQSLLASGLFYSMIFSFPITLYHYVLQKYKMVYSRITFWYAYPKIFLILSSSMLTVTYFTNPNCSVINKNDMAPSSIEEETFKMLIEKCDIYDHIDAILSLKDRYTMYDMEQLSKEHKFSLKAVQLENMEKFRDKRLSKH